MRDLGETTLERLRMLHANYSDDGRTRDVMTALFGQPEQCLVCAEPLEWGGKRIPDDVDPWFCGEHCPICSTDEELMEDLV